MALTIQDYIDEINRGIYKPKARISFLRLEDESIYADAIGDIAGGSLQISRNNGVRRSCNISLVNVESEYIPNVDGIWVNSKFFLELGLEIDGENYFFPQGIFVVRNPSVVSTNSSSTLEISGIDKFSLLDGQLGGNLNATYIIPDATDINDSIKTILELYLDDDSLIPLDSKTPILQAIEAGKEDTPYTVRQDIGGTYGNVLLELNAMLSRNMFYNELGHLVFEEDFNDSTKGSEWDFTEEKSAYLGSRHTYEFEQLYNKIIVIGDNINGQIFDATATNANSQSDTNISRIGVKIKVIEDSIIYTTELAEKRAEYELKRLNALQSAITITSVPMYHLDVDRVITLTDSKLGLDEERFVIQSINIPLGVGGIMTTNAVRSEELVLS